MDNTHHSPVIEVTRNIGDRERLILCVLAGGRCEFDGCNEYLFEHALTHKRFNFAEMAHIVAFSERGPRGNDTLRPADINNLDNLMLLCHRDHKLIDDHPADYTRATLEAYKKAHEDRISLLSSTAPDRKTTAVSLLAKVGGQTVTISPPDIYAAVAPRYTATRTGTPIDLTKFTDGDPEYYSQAARQIRQDLERIQADVMREEGTHHISLFAIAAMPLLMVAGNAISNKVPCDLYQLHRDTQDWKWKPDGVPVAYKFEQIHLGADASKVALILSLSGKIDANSVVEMMGTDAYLYEITLDGIAPSPGFLRTAEDLSGFQVVYQQALRQINAYHGRLQELHVFPAVPAPIAVACGRDVFPKVDPALIVYDDDKRAGGFRRILEVNQ